MATQMPEQAQQTAAATSEATLTPARNVAELFCLAAAALLVNVGVAALAAFC